MNLARRLSVLRMRRRLRRLADDYWQSEAKDESLIAAYIAGLAQIRNLTGTGKPKERALHLGSGGHRLEGWINADITPSPSIDAVFDIEDGLPFASERVAWIHSEDLLEHLDQPTGRVLAGEAFRVLEPGGVMRVVTPDLRAIVDRVYLARDRSHLRWCERELGAASPCEALNMHMRMEGEHRFLYDWEQLQVLLESAGFEVRLMHFGRSSHLELRNLDLRDFGLSLYCEATRPR